MSLHACESLHHNLLRWHSPSSMHHVDMPDHEWPSDDDQSFTSATSDWHEKEKPIAQDVKTAETSSNKHVKESDARFSPEEEAVSDDCSMYSDTFDFFVVAAVRVEWPERLWEHSLRKRLLR